MGEGSLHVEGEAARVQVQTDLGYFKQGGLDFRNTGALDEDWERVSEGSTLLASRMGTLGSGGRIDEGLSWDDSCWVNGEGVSLRDAPG